MAQYGREKMILEPSFVSERLGLQGRVDLMTTDFRLLVEQKAGRNMNIERHKMGLHGSQQLEKHYVQLLLYFAILHYNLGKSSKTTDIKLLYSKYEPQDGLLVVNNLQSLLMEAMTLRNRIVATAYWITRADTTNCCLISRRLRSMSGMMTRCSTINSSFQKSTLRSNHCTTCRPSCGNTSVG